MFTFSLRWRRQKLQAEKTERAEGAGILRPQLEYTISWHQRRCYAYG